MMARLTTLPDALRGGAWPSPARAVRCPVNPRREIIDIKIMGVLAMDWLEYLAGYVVGDGYLYCYKRGGKYFVRMVNRDESFLRQLQRQVYDNLGCFVFNVQGLGL